MKKIIEIEISLYLEEKETGKILTKLIYSTVIELINLEIRRELLEKIILVEIPEKVYEDMRKIFIFLFQNSGFKDVKIDQNVDFRKLYESRKFNKNFFFVLY